MILTISDSEEGILNKIKSVLACESTLEVMEITNSEKLTFQGLEIDQLQRSVIKDGKVVDLVEHWSEHFARSAPVRIEIQQNGLVGMQYLIVKIRSSNFQFSHKKGSFLLYLIILCFSACKYLASWFP